MGPERYDPYDPDKNPLGTRSLLSGYLSGATAVGTGLAYSALVTTQQALDISGIDAGLAVEIGAYQQLMKQQAGYFTDTVTGNFIGLSSSARNFAALMIAFATSDHLSGGSVDSTRTAAGERLDALAAEAGEISVDADAAMRRLSELEQLLNANATRLDRALTSAIERAGNEAAAASKQIDELVTAIDKNIADIVAGANESGKAVADLGIGLLTQFATSSAQNPETKKGGDGKEKKAGSDASKPADDQRTADGQKSRSEVAEVQKPERKDDKVPSVDFVISAVKAGSVGVGKYSTAIASMNTNNDKLAAAYQGLASVNALVAVAKATQAQKNLFVAAVSDAAKAVAAIKSDWSSVRGGLVSTSAEARTVQTEHEAQALASLAQGAKKLWMSLSEEVASIKQALTGSGGLPSM